MESTFLDRARALHRVLADTIECCNVMDIRVVVLSVGPAPEFDSLAALESAARRGEVFVEWDVERSTVVTRDAFREFMESRGEDPSGLLGRAGGAT